MHPPNRSWDNNGSHRRGILAADNEALASELCVKVDLLKELSKNIGQEVRDQNNFLDGTLSDMFTRSENMLRKALNRADSGSPLQQQARRPSANRFVLPLLIVLIIIFDCIFNWPSDRDKYNIEYELASSKERLQSGYAQFYLLNEPACLEVKVTPYGRDVDLYVVANEDISFFKERLPLLKKFLTSSNKETKGINSKSSIYKLDPPQAWEVIAPSDVIKSNNSHLENVSDTVYWSTGPTFTLSSLGLGVEKVFIPKAFKRPLLVIVFAPSGGFFVKSAEPSKELEDSQFHHYTIQIFESDEKIISTYESVRAEAEENSLSYDQLASMYSTLREKDQRVYAGTSKSSHNSPTAQTRNGGDEGRNLETGQEEESMKGMSMTKFFLFEFLEIILNAIV
ncbi:unnamed protein product [Hymenolepis diminuta]|uniref:t-SNARE coiled-coil homology domain-containing protein n=1 Tax=Hymenolepis diminuta TaxID=6216 RepID=A0A0R3SI61_HYMDI|nr:unnamed protein product [Hymenolepis diminuta]